MLGVNSWEFVLLLGLAVLILGPERLPEYAAKLARLVQQARSMAEGAKGQLKEQLGPDFEDVDWRQYDPRQYDPRRIVREALMAPATAAEQEPPVAGGVAPRLGYDPEMPTPYDVDAT